MSVCEETEATEAIVCTWPGWFRHFTNQRCTSRAQYEWRQARIGLPGNEWLSIPLWWERENGMSNESSTGKHVYKAINEVKRVLAKHGGITKDREAVAGGRYQFRGIDDMYNVLCGITADAGLVMIPRVVGSPRIDYGVTAKGGAQTHVYLDLEVDFVSELDSSMHTGRYVGEAIDMSDKAANKAMSAAFKYAHLMVFQIPTHGQESDDTENDNIPIAPPPQRREPPPQATGPRGGPSLENGTPMPVQQASDPLAAQISNGQLAPATAAGPGPAKATRAPRQPKAQHTEATPTPPNYPLTAAQTITSPAVSVEDQPFPAGPPANAPPSNALLGRVGEVQTFPLLYAVAQEAESVTDPNARAELFMAIRNRGVFLFASAKSAAEVKEGFPLVTALGQPDELKRAANEAHVRFRQ